MVSCGPMISKSTEASSEGRRSEGSSFFDRNFKWFILPPAILVLVVAAVVPTVWVIFTSFFENNYLEGTFRFIGFENYVELLTSSRIWGFIGNTLLYVGGSVGFGFIISLFLARLLSTEIRFRGFWLVAILLPWIFPQIAGAIMWNWMIHQQYGILNFILLKLNLIDQFVPFLAQTSTAFLMLIWVDLWYWTPFATLVLFGGFIRVPKEMNEAARVDGATALGAFWHIELPYIMPEILAVLLLRTMFTFREFGIPFLMGQGGPARSTEVLGLTIYRESISHLNLGRGAALSVILLLIMVIIAVFYFRILRSNKGLQEEPAYD